VGVVALLLGCGSAEERDAEPEQPASSVPAGTQAAGYREITLPFIPEVDPLRAAVGDVDEDGLPDLAVSGTTADQGWVRLYIGASGGEFVVGRDLEVPMGPRALLLADFNGDGHLDLATGNARAGEGATMGNATVYPGDGAGDFGSAIELLLPHSPSGLAAGDLDGDGRLDLVGVSEGGVVGLFYGRENGRFHRGQYEQTEYGPSDVVLADMDSDGDLDVVVPVWKSDHVLVYPNEGNRKLGPPTRVDVAARNPFGVAVLDVDWDGRLDLVVPDLGGEPLDVRLGAEGGTFRAGTRLPSASGIRNLAVGDLDGDGRTDFVSTASNAGRVVLYYSRGQGRFFTQDLLEPGQQPRSTSVADLNQDGVPDLVTPNAGSKDVTLFLSEPDRVVALHEVRVVTDEELPELQVLRRDYRRALRAYRVGNRDAALPAFEKIVEASEPLFREGRLMPDPRSQEWIRYHASLLLLSDLYRYTRKEGAKARDLEASLAEAAESQGHLRLAAIQWLAVGEIEEQSLDDAEAAAAAYERVVALGGRPSVTTGPVPQFIVDMARRGIDRLHAGEEGYANRLSRVEVPYVVDLSHGEVTRLMLPHLEGYGSDRDPVKLHQAFARSHAGSFRGAFADYAAMLVAIIFPGRFQPGLELADKYVEWYPERVLSFGAHGHLLSYFHKTKREKAYQRMLARAEQGAADLGVEMDLDLTRSPI
jgi:hypothetical protein